jgi:hypothetical protein
MTKKPRGTTSADLESMLVAMTPAANGCGLKIGPTVQTGIPKIVLDDAVAYENVLQAAADLGVRVVFPSLTRFDPEDEDDERIQEHLEKRGVEAGDLLCVSFHWAADGVHFAWSRATDAYSEALDLGADTEEPVHVDEEFVERQSGNRKAQDQYRQNIRDSSKRFEEKIIGDAEFRGLTPERRKRRAADICGRLPEDPEDRFGWQRGRENALERAKDEIKEWENDVLSRLPDVGKKLSQTPGWQPFGSNAAQQKFAAEFLMAYCDGWRLSGPVSARLAEQSLHYVPEELLADHRRRPPAVV